MAAYFLNPKPTSEFALRRSLDNHPAPVHLRPALLTLLTSVLYRIPPYSLVLSHDANRSSSQPPPLLFGLISAPLGHLQGAFTLGCQSGHQELCIDSSRERESGRMPHRRFKPFNSWRYTQMWQYRQEKQKENIPVTPICSGQSIQEQNNYSLIS